MKKLICTMVASCVVLGLGLSLRAQEARPEGATAERNNAGYIDWLDKMVNLTDGQKKQIRDAQDARDKVIKDFQDQNAEKIKAAADALVRAQQSKDADAVAKASKEYGEVLKPLSVAYAMYHEIFSKILTAEQKAAWAANSITNMVTSAIAPVKLTEEQAKQVKAIVAEAAKPASADGGEAQVATPGAGWIAVTAGGSYPKVLQKVGDILTADQKAEVLRFRVLSSAKAQLIPAQITGDQGKALELAYDELAKDTKLTPAQLQEKLYAKIPSLLTDEQRTAVEGKLHPLAVYIPWAAQTEFPAQIPLTGNSLGEIKANPNPTSPQSK